MYNDEVREMMEERLWLEGYRPVNGQWTQDEAWRYDGYTEEEVYEKALALGELEDYGF